MKAPWEDPQKQRFPAIEEEDTDMSRLSMGFFTAFRTSSRFLLVVALLLVGRSVPVMGDSGTGRMSGSLRVGQSIGQFQVPDLAGKMWSQLDFQDRLTVVFLWSFGCPYCMAEMPDVDSFAKTTKDGNNVRLVTMNIDDPAIAPRVSALMRENSAEFPVLMVGKWLEDARVPRTLLVDSSGVIIDGFSGKIIGRRSRSSWCSRVNEMLVRAGKHKVACKKGR